MQESTVNISNSKLHKPLNLTCALLTVPYRYIASHTLNSHDPQTPTCTVNISYFYPCLPLTLTLTRYRIHFILSYSHHPQTLTCTVNISYCNPYLPLIFTRKLYSKSIIYTSQFSLSNSHHPKTITCTVLIS